MTLDPEMPVYTTSRGNAKKERNTMTLDPQLPKISVRGLLMQAFLTGWEKSDKSISQDEYLQSAIQVIEMLQVEPERCRCILQAGATQKRSVTQ